MNDRPINQIYGHYVPCSHAAILVMFAESCGIDMKPVLQNHGLSIESISTPGARMAATQYSQLLLEVDALGGEDGFWFRFGLQLDFPAYDVLGQLILSCDTVRQAIQLLAKYYQLLSCGSELVCIDEGGSLCVKIYRQGDAGARVNIIRSELLVSVIFNGILVALADRGEKLRFEFDYRKPAHASLYSKYLNRHCVFAAEQSKVIIPAEYLQRPCPHPNPALLKILITQCDQLLAQLQGHQSITAQVRTVIAAIPGHYPVADTVAQKIGVSSRTLNRRLKDQGTTFQRLVNEVKAQRAVNYLQCTEKSIEEVATLLGFSDSANFRRAFVSWMGILPSQYRKTQQLVSTS